MADDRMYLRHIETGEEIMLGKVLGGRWGVYEGLAEDLQKFFDKSIYSVFSSYVLVDENGRTAEMLERLASEEYKILLRTLRAAGAPLSPNTGEEEMVERALVYLAAEGYSLTPTPTVEKGKK